MTPEPRGSACARLYGQGALDAVTEIVSICDQLADFAEVGKAGFSSDVRTQWAVEIGLIRLGECFNRLPESFRSERPEQPWWALTVDIPSLRIYLAESAVIVEVELGPPELGG